MKKLFTYSDNPDTYVDPKYLGEWTPEKTGTRRRFHELLENNGTDDWSFNGWYGAEPNLDENTLVDVDRFIGEVSKYAEYYLQDGFEKNLDSRELTQQPLIIAEMVKFHADLTHGSRDFDFNANPWAADSTNLSLGAEEANPLAIFTSSNRHFFCDGMEVFIENIDGDFVYFKTSDGTTPQRYYVKTLTAYTFALYKTWDGVDAFGEPVQILKLPENQYDYDIRFTEPQEPVIIRFYDAEYNDGTEYDFQSHGESAMVRWKEFRDEHRVFDIDGSSLWKDYWVDDGRGGTGDDWLGSGTTSDGRKYVDYFLHKHKTNSDALFPADLVDPHKSKAFTRYSKGTINNSEPTALFWDRGDWENYPDDIEAADANRSIDIWDGTLFDSTYNNPLNEGNPEYNPWTIYHGSVFGGFSDGETTNGNIGELNGELYIKGTENKDVWASLGYAMSVSTAVSEFPAIDDYAFEVLTENKEGEFFIATSGKETPDVGVIYGSDAGLTPDSNPNNKIYNIGETGFPIIATNYNPSNELIIFLGGNDLDEMFEHHDASVGEYPIVEMALPWNETDANGTLNSLTENGDFLRTFNTNVPYFYAERVDTSWYQQDGRYSGIKSQHLHYDSGIPTLGQAVKLYYDKALTKPVVAPDNWVPMSIALPVQNFDFDNNTGDMRVELHNWHLPAPRVLGDTQLQQDIITHNHPWATADETLQETPRLYRLLETAKLKCSFVGLEDINFEAGTGDFWYPHESVIEEKTWTATGGWKWSNLNGGTFVGSGLTARRGWNPTEGGINRTTIDFNIADNPDITDFHGIVYDEGDYPYNPYDDTSGGDVVLPLTDTGDVIGFPVSYYPYEARPVNNLFYNTTQWQNDNTNNQMGGARAANPDGTATNIGAYIIIEWGFFLPVNRTDDTSTTTTMTESNFHNIPYGQHLLPEPEYTSIGTYVPDGEGAWDGFVQGDVLDADWDFDTDVDETYYIKIGSDWRNIFEATNYVGTGYDFYDDFYFDKELFQIPLYNAEGSAYGHLYNDTISGTPEFSPMTNVLFKATELTYFPHPFDKRSVDLDVFDENAAEATTGLVEIADDFSNPVHLDIDNMEYLVPANNTYLYYDWNTEEYKAGSKPVNTYWWITGDWLPIYQSYEKNPTADTVGCGRRLTPYAGEAYDRLDAPNGDENEVPYDFYFGLDANGRMLGQSRTEHTGVGGFQSGDNNLITKDNVGRFRLDRVGEVLLQPNWLPDIGEPPEPDCIALAETWYHANEWMDTDDAPSDERYFPAPVDDECFLPNRAKLIVDQPSASSTSQSGIKYVRSSGFTKFRLELTYPPLEQKQFELVNAAIHRARGEMRSFKLDLRHPKGYNWLFGQMGYFRDGIHSPSGLGYDKAYHENVSFPNRDGSLGALRHHNYLLVVQDVMPNDTLIRVQSFRSDVDTLCEGSVVGGLGGRNGGINTIVATNQSNIWGESEFRVAYPLQATYQSGYDMNTPILRKGDYWYPEPDFLQVSFDEDSFDFNINVIRRYGFSLKFLLDDLR